MAGVKWKTLFVALLVGNILVISVIVILVNWPVKDKELTKYMNKGNEIQFQVETTKDDLNQLINQYLKREGLTGTFHYEVYVTDSVELYGKMPFFNREVDFKMTFKPIVKENGDLLLKQESISVGKVNLPVSYMMNFINKRYKTPHWLMIQPDDQSIYVALHDMELKSDVRVKAKEFDLEHNNISFLLTIPSLQP